MSENLKEIEQCVLGSCLCDNEIARQVVSKIDETYFYNTYAKKLFLIIKETPKIDINIIALKTCEDDILNGYTAECYRAVSISSGAFWEEYIRLLTEYKIRREIKNLGFGMTQIGDADDIKDLIDNASEKINSLRPAEIKDKKKELDDIIAEYEDLKKRGNEMDSGFPGLDKLINGFKRKRFYVLGGDPGSGKTGLALYLAQRIAFVKNKMKVLFFSLEMSKFEIVGRLTSILFCVPPFRIEQPQFLTPEDFLHLTNTVGKIYKSNLEIEDGVWNIGDILQKIKQEKPDIVFIDHLQFIQIKLGKYEKRYEALDSIAKNLKNIAKKENISVFAISHNKRDGEKNFDFDGTSGIKKIADVGMMLIRPVKKKDSIMQKPDNYAELKIIKNRFGRAGSVGLLLNEANLRFAEFVKSGTDIL